MNNLTLRVIIFLYIFTLISCSSDHSSEEQNIDTTPPEINLEIAGFGKNSTDPIIVGHSIDLNPNTTDNEGIKSVTIFLNNEVVAQSNTPPFNFTIDLSSYTSKVADLTKYKEYVLKVVVVDINDNSSEVEQIIYIDNDLPSISNVTIENGTILNGDENIVTFNAYDEQGIKEVSAMVDNSSIVVAETETGFTLDLNTLNSADGEHSLVIIAEDFAENITSYQVDFISDNTGPELIVEGIMDDIILGEKTIISTSLSDEFSEISGFKISVGDSLVKEFENFDELNFEFDPESYAVGEYELIFEASDSVGNISQINVPIKIKRLLMIIDIKEDYLPSNYPATQLFYLASDINGKVLDFAKGENNSIVKLYSEREFSLEEEFMLTLMEISGYLNGPQSGEMFTISNLKRNIHNTYTLKTRKQNPNYKITTDFKLTGMDPCAQNLTCYGPGYNIFYSHSGDEDIQIRTFDHLGDPTLSSDKIYLFLEFSCFDQYKYLAFDNPLPEDIETNISVSDFIDEGIQNSSVEFSNVGLVDIDIKGYDSLEDYRTNNGYSIFDDLKSTFYHPGPVNYFWLDVFQEYKFKIVSDDFAVIGRGLPETYYEVPDWSVDHLLNDKTIQYTIDSGEHTVGKTIIQRYANQYEGQFEWIFVFDSQKTQEITIPEIPEELKDYQLYNHMQNRDFMLYQSQITKYDGIETYDEYLEKIILPNKSYQSFGDKMTAKYRVHENASNAFIIDDFFMYRILY
ncbi:Ig-like domain-containing protein [Flagellimonas zhangzhouensis]|uniref:Uncharacterized protein n=1 Tax=Flagellimonas zhangzhouensis TaxID=1073328 RepID=A0A1H2QA16_9FLAO|nr:Ig-like domain-containing protein [Allomuricauda zhangzhouensis]SDQ49810.1 hypothetical protein SAMN05216294_1462 [Allomuricauda zhangzhouensis]SDW03249.1 hypothetical protein SAMN04487892_0113 [Allomuricauda zhangzhouensis]